MFRPYKVKKTDAEPMESIMKHFIRSRGLATGMNLQLVFNAWDKVSGAGQFTIRRFFRDETLHCSISSSVVRNQLYFQKDVLLKALNEELSNEPLYDRSKGFVKNIVLR